MLNDKKFKSILCLNGELPEREFFFRDLPIIAADGALQQLHELKIKPDIAIGDLDSVDKSLLLKYPHLHDPDQSTSDFQKCLVYMQEKNLLPAIFVGMQGGYIDHVLHNINIFVHTESIFYAPPVVGFTIKSQQTQRIKTEIDSKLSLMGLPSATVQTQGLKWDVDNMNLVFPGKNSCFNRASQCYVDITVHTGCLLVLLYLEPVLDAGLGDLTKLLAIA